MYLFALWKTCYDRSSLSDLLDIINYTDVIFVSINQLILIQPVMKIINLVWVLFKKFETTSLRIIWSMQSFFFHLPKGHLFAFNHLVDAAETYSFKLALQLYESKPYSNTDAFMKRQKVGEIRWSRTSNPRS